MRNHPSPRDSRSWASNFGDPDEFCRPQVAEAIGGVSGLVPELWRVDQLGRVELEVRGPNDPRRCDASCSGRESLLISLQ